MDGLKATRKPNGFYLLDYLRNEIPARKFYGTNHKVFKMIKGKLFYGRSSTRWKRRNTSLWCYDDI